MPTDSRSSSRRSGKPLAAVASQGIVAGSSLLLQLIAYFKLGEDGLGRFAVLFGILITVNSIQSGWLGDSLTVLDRFDPGIRRALVRSQLAIVGLVFVSTTILATFIGGIGDTTAVLFGIASVAWVVEETLRRLLIARRDFTNLVINDAAFAIGSFGLVGFVALTGGDFTIETLVLALLAGAVVAIGVGVVQLPSHELSRGLLGPSRMREMASFAVWRAAQIGLRPGSQTIVRFVIIAVASEAALGQLEAARLLLAPVLTVVNGAGVYLLPTYTEQAKARRRFRPAVPLAMAGIGSIAVVYGFVALALRQPLSDLRPGGADDSAITVMALLAWTAFSVGFGAGVPAGNAMVAMGRSRAAFGIRVVDAVVGVVVASVLAVVGQVDAAPFGLALGTAVGAALLLLRLRVSDADPTTHDDSSDGDPLDSQIQLPRELVEDSDLDSLFTPPSDAGKAGRDVSALSTATLSTSTPAPHDSQGLADSASSPRPVTATRRRRINRVRVPDGNRLLWLAPLVAIFVTEYKFRRRDIDDALGGSVDLMILAELAIYGLIGMWAFWHLAPTKPRLTPLLVAMWGYILTTAVSSLYSTFPFLALARGVQIVIIGAAVHALAVDGRLSQVVKLVHAWIVLMTASIFVGLAYVAPTTGPQVGRFTWLFVHSVSAGSMLALSVPMLFGLWLSAGRSDNPLTLPWPRNVYGLLFVFQLVFLMLTRTRGSIGGTVIALAVMAWIWSGQRAKPQLVLGSLVVGGASLLAFSKPVINFMTRGESAEKIGTFNRRTEIWSLAWDSFLDRPLHGLGLSSAKGVFFDETGLGGAHNALINVMIDVGLAGLIWWTILIVAVCVAIFRLGRSARSGEIVSGAIGSARADHLVLVGLIVSSLINSVTTEGLGAGVNISAIWLYLIVAWISIVRREAERPGPADTISSATASNARGLDQSAASLG